MTLRLTRWWLVGTVVVAGIVVAAWILWPGRPATGGAMAGWEAQVDLPLPVPSASGIAVSPGGDVYAVTSERVLKLPAGRYTPVDVPVPELIYPHAIAIDRFGDLLLSDYTKERFLEVSAAAKTIVVLPFTGLGTQDPAAPGRSYEAGVAVDRAENVYVTDPDNSRVLMLPAGSDSPTQLARVDHLGAPILVSDTGEVVVTCTDPVTRIVRIVPGTTAPVATVLADLQAIAALALDQHGNLVLADNIRVPDPDSETGATRTDGRLWRIPAGSSTPIRLPYTDLGEIAGLAVDRDDSILVADSAGGRVTRLAGHH